MDFDFIMVAAGLGEAVPYILAASGLAAWITATIPAPRSGWQAKAWKALNWLAANVWRARNAKP